MTSSIGALFVEHQRALEAIDRLVECDCPLESISLLMSDRTMQRALSLASRITSELPIPLSNEARKLAARLKPLAPLGAPGAGSVGTGPVIAPLERAGLGSARGIHEALGRCGVNVESVTLVAKAIRNSGMLVFVDASNERIVTLARQVFDGAVAVFELEGNHEPLPQGGIWLPTPMQGMLLNTQATQRAS